MLQNAPKFYEVAKRIIEITEGCVTVAHNAEFDNRILKTEFKRLGFDYKRKTLCTVELSKILIPNQTSYSLGKLTRALGIPVSDRHRAAGDAQATITLFKLLLAKDLDKKIVKASIKLDTISKLNPKHTDIIEQLPSITGVYYIHKSDGEIIYIGKSKNIKKRVNQHFINTNIKSKKIQLQVHTVTYEETGSELIALLKESEEIKRNKPIFNRALKQTDFSHGLYSFTDDNGYLNLKIEQVNGKESPITTFSNYRSAKSFLTKITDEHNLCQKLTGLHLLSNGSCFNHTIKQCFGACIAEETQIDYNNRVTNTIDKYSFNSQSIVIVDRGRAIDERSAILIENGEFKGYGFYNLNYQINTIDVLNSIITKMQSNGDTQHIIQSYLRKHKKLKIVELKSTNHYK